VRFAVEYDIATILEIKEPEQMLKVMQEEFEQRIGQRRFFRITGTPACLARVSADLDDSRLRGRLENPPNPHGRWAAWDVRPLPPLNRNALGFENERADIHHMKFVKNGHLEFWTEVDSLFCWRQNVEEMEVHPRLYPYAVVEHPVSFVRLYRSLADFLGFDCDVILQLQFVNIKGAILFPHRPGTTRFDFPVEPVTPLERNRLVFQPKKFAKDFDSDPTALDLIKDLYYEFGYGREHIPFFNETGHCEL
jgi:hypothetical protein